MNADTTTRGFIAIELSKDISTTLATVQHSLRTQAKSENVKVQFVPKAVLYLPIEDLGKPEEPSFEAAIMAVKRATTKIGPFVIELGALREWRGEGACQQILATVDDPDGGLAKIRNALMPHLERYGFATTPGIWNPHVPLARIPANDLNFETEEISSKQSMKVDSVAVIHRKPTPSGNMRFKVRARVLLTEDGSRDGEALDDAARTEEIAAELSERLSRRKAPLSVRKRKRAHQIDEQLDNELDESLDGDIANEE